MKPNPMSSNSPKAKRIGVLASNIPKNVHENIVTSMSSYAKTTKKKEWHYNLRIQNGENILLNTFTFFNPMKTCEMS